ncbi:MAG: glycolate oxidase subunit GlcF [Gammaproteobacteria bacterium]|nr:glycolate oxidase subunit GlcF [Gammaproteobacteria bacterium]
MQTFLDPRYARSSVGREADAILRKCVHCGLCNATCPTYQLLGDELDGPRGRIYLIKQLLEGENPGDRVQLHLDRCLTCRNCETACPSGVEYSRLLGIGREALSQSHQRSPVRNWIHRGMAGVIANPVLFGWLLRTGGLFRPVMPKFLKSRIPVPGLARYRPVEGKSHPRKMIALSGCVQGALAPDTNRATAMVLDKLGISLVEIPGAGCCGSLDLHTTREDLARQRARALIDHWLPHLDRGVEGFVMTASGCGVTIKEYPHLFRADAEYREKSTRISSRTFDLCEILEREMDDRYTMDSPPRKVAFHAPCTLQHGQKLPGRVEAILERAGHEIVAVPDSHVCCGSAGVYSLFHPVLSGQLREKKLQDLMRNRPDVICTANVGCQSHLALGGDQPVKHWVELLV